MNIKSGFARSLLGVGGGTLILTLGQAFVILIGTRYLEADELGIYFILVASAGIIASIAACGTNIGLIKYTVDSDQDDKIPLITSSFIFYLLSLIVVISISLVINHISQYISIEIEYIAFVISFSIFFYLNYVLQALKKFKSVAIANSSNGLMKMCVTFFVMAYLGYGWHGYIWSIVTSNIIAIFMQLMFVAKDVSHVDFKKYDLKKFRSMLRFSLPIYLNQVYSNLYDRGNTLLIALLLDPVAVSFYGVATMIPSFVIQMRQVFNGVYFPKMCELIKTNTMRASLLLEYSVALMFLLISFGSVIFFSMDEYVVKMLFTNEYIEVCLAIFILLSRSAYAFGSSIMGFTLVSLNKNAIPFKINVFVTTLSFSIGYFAIPIYGYMGAVYVALFSSVLSFVINSYCLKIYGLELRVEYSVLIASIVFLAANILSILNYTNLAIIAMIAFIVVAAYSIRKLDIMNLLKGRINNA